METTNPIESFDKEALLDQIRDKYITANSLELSDEDRSRPWGAFFVIAPESTDQFLDTFYPNIDKDEVYKYGEEIQPKILVVVPGAQLSWQVHERRAEIWKALEGPVGFKENTSDDLPDNIETLNTGEIVQHPAQTRHRLIGLDGVGVVAEIWQHTVPGSPSDEADNRRIVDDYGRN